MSFVPMFVANPNSDDPYSKALAIGGEYDPGISVEVDRAIRHLPGVVSHCIGQAHKLLERVGSSNFEVIESTSKDLSRPRIYVAPKNNTGIHEELSQAVLLKAALGMAGSGN